ncbi:MAG: hypothetical protein WCR52_10685 [Bacteroidota bacterium]
MLHKKLLEVLQRLTRAEHKRLRLFLQSPYFSGSNNAENILRLYDYIFTFNAEESHPQLEKEVVFRHFFPDRVFKEKEKSPLDSLASDLFSLVRRFLGQLHLEDTDMIQQDLLALARFYRNFGLEDRFSQTIDSLRKNQKESKARGVAFFYMQYLIETEDSEFQLLYNSQEDDSNLKEVHKSLDIYFSLLKLENICAYNHQTRFSKIEKEPDNVSILSRAVIDLGNAGTFDDIALAQIYLTVNNLIADAENDSLFSKFELQLEQYKTEIPFDKYRDLKTFYRHYLGHQYIKHGSEFTRQRIFEIYKEHFEEGYFYINDRIEVRSLRVLLLFALKQGQYEWIKNVLEKHPPEKICGTKYPAEIYSIYWSEYYFYIQDYNAAFEKLVYRNFESPIYSLLADVLLIKIYFETQDDLIESRMKAMDQKIRRTNIASEIKERFNNFLKKLDKIIKYRWLKDKAKLAKINEEIKSTTNIMEREWLLEKLGNGPTA